MKRFYLKRLEDETGVSGTGIVAEGVQFQSGWCALTWLVGQLTLAFYPNIATIEKIHGHNGKTLIVWIDHP